jgi:hypothetical protein
MGVYTGDAITTGEQNVAVGDASLTACTTGTDNVAIGDQSLKANTTANNNTAVGSSALLSNTTGTPNTAVGFEAMDANTTGSRNTALGVGTLGANTTADENTAVGYAALLLNTTGASNTAVGYGALESNTTGIQNTVLGGNAGDSITTGTGNICIGKGADTAAADSVYSITMGRDVTSVGNYHFTFGVDSSVHRVYNEFITNATWTRVSDERIKKDIATNTDCGLDFINDLRTVTYKFKAPSELDSSMTGYDASKTEALHKNKMYGFVAQEVKSAMDAHNITDFAGHHQANDNDDKMQGISYEMFVMPLVKAVQELSAEIEELKNTKCKCQ